MKFCFNLTGENQNMSSITEQHFEYVTAFLTENGDEDILTAWQDESNKKKFESSTKKKSATKKKDPNTPKRAKSSYNCFCEAKREEVKAKYPEENILSKLGAEWTAFKALCDAGDEDANEEMKVYQAAAAQSKEDYTAAMAVYKPPSDDELLAAKPAKKEVKSKEVKSKEVKPKEVKSPKEAKRPPSNYNLFTKDRKAEMTDFKGSHKEFMKATGDEWKAHKEANDEVFKRYSDLADQLKKDFGIVQKAPSAKKPVKKAAKQPVLSDEEEEEEDEEEDVVKKVVKKATITPPANKTTSPAFKKFATIRRNALKKEMAERGEPVSAAVVTDTLLTEWKAMDDEDRKPYE